VKCRNPAAKLEPMNSAMISPGPLLGKEVGVGVGVVVVGAVLEPLDFFAPLEEDELGGVAGGAIAVLGALLVGLGAGVGVLIPWLVLLGETVVGAGAELLENLW
jgi:hypothetical protein